MSRRTAFGVLVGAVIVQRLAELRTSRRHEAALVARGATVHARGQLPAAAALHTAWLASSLAEGTRRLRRPADGRLIALGLGGLAVGHALRLASMRALGERWTASVVTVPGAARVRTGIFQHLRHPNYLGVAVEVAALPLVAGAWRTAAVFSGLNVLFLRARIRAEDRALDVAEAATGARPYSSESSASGSPSPSHSASMSPVTVL